MVRNGMGGDIARLWFGMRCGAVRLRFGMRCGTVRLRYGTDEFLGVISWCGTWWEDVTCDYGAEQSEGLVVILRCGTRGHDFMGLRDFHGNFCAKLTAKFLGFDTIPAQSKKIKEADMAKNREISSCVTGTFKKGVRIPRIYLASALALGPRRGVAAAERLDRHQLPEQLEWQHPSGQWRLHDVRQRQSRRRLYGDDTGRDGSPAEASSSSAR